MKKNQVETLDKCIELLASPKKLEDFLDSLEKQERQEILNLLKVAEQLYLQAPSLPSPEKKEAIKARVLAFARPQIPVSQKLTSSFALKRAVAAAALFFVLGSGVAVAANRSLPNSLLYPVKQATERIRLAIARNKETKARLEINFARRRLNESKAVLNQPAALQRTIEAMNKDTSSAVQKLLEAHQDSKDELAAELVALTEKQQEVLSSVIESAPEAAKESLMKALEVSRRGHQQAIKALTKEKGAPHGPKIEQPKAMPPSPPVDEDRRSPSPPTPSFPLKQDEERGIPEIPQPEIRSKP